MNQNCTFVVCDTRASLYLVRPPPTRRERVTPPTYSFYSPLILQSSCATLSITETLTLLVVSNSKAPPPDQSPGVIPGEQKLILARPSSSMKSLVKDHHGPAKHGHSAHLPKCNASARRTCHSQVRCDIRMDSRRQEFMWCDEDY
jgi:hypothetical protein